MNILAYGRSSAQNTVQFLMTHLTLQIGNLVRGARKRIFHRAHQLDHVSYIDISTPDFPGIFAVEKGFFGPRLTHESHPHMRLEESMISVPTVRPGDMVFWHCDVVHSVEREHTGRNDSSGALYSFLSAMVSKP